MKLIIFLLSWSFMTIFHGSPKENFYQGKYKPLLNDNLKYFMTVNGHIDPALQKQVKLQWKISYYASNTDCNIETNHLEGVVSTRRMNELIMTIPDKKGDYQYKIPLDRYLLGYCQWRIGSVYYSVVDAGHGIIINFSKQKSITHWNNTSVNLTFVYDRKKRRYRVVDTVNPYLSELITGQAYEKNNYKLAVNLLLKAGGSHAKN